MGDICSRLSMSVDELKPEGICDNPASPTLSSKFQDSQVLYPAKTGQTLQRDRPIWLTAGMDELLETLIKVPSFIHHGGILCVHLLPKSGRGLTR